MTFCMLSDKAIAPNTHYYIFAPFPQIPTVKKMPLDLFEYLF